MRGLLQCIFLKGFLTTLNKRRGIRHHASLFYAQRGAGERQNRDCSGISARRSMETRKTILLTSLACFALFTLFAFCSKDCSKDEKGSNGDNGGTLSTLNLSGTTWESSMDDVVVSLHFTTENSGYYHWISGDDVTINFTYSLNGIHGTVNGSSEIFFPSSAVLVIIDENTIGIGGRAFTRQQILYKTTRVSCNSNKPSSDRHILAVGAIRG